MAACTSQHVNWAVLYAGVMLCANVRSYGQPAHYLILGDQGGTPHPEWNFSSKAQQDVANQMAVLAHTVGPISLVIGTGDNMYWDGVTNVDDPRFAYSFENVYHHRELQDVPFYLALGNHDYTGPDPTQRNVSAQVLYTGRGTGRWRMPARYYTVVLREEGPASVQMWVLDSCALVGALTNKCDHNNLQACYHTRRFATPRSLQTTRTAAPVWR
eukprot:TRINITY_DN4125_c0_g1_i2.p1 TRINITY_DN4125_c0_g1~~TRINITY_DN4125_c0_g1_i2.p1  ORF type:complete len:214 (+),score=24.70 TRINITY_DN4125_c0_g1_i2:31-672(+)